MRTWVFRAFHTTYYDGCWHQLSHVWRDVNIMTSNGCTWACNVSVSNRVWVTGISTSSSSNTDVTKDIDGSCSSCSWRQKPPDGKLSKVKPGSLVKLDVNSSDVFLHPERQGHNSNTKLIVSFGYCCQWPTRTLACMTCWLRGSTRCPLLSVHLPQGCTEPTGGGCWCRGRGGGSLMREHWRVGYHGRQGYSASQQSSNSGRL